MDKRETELLKKLAVVYLMRACSNKFRVEYNTSVEIALHFAEEVGGEFYKSVQNAVSGSDAKHTERILELTKRLESQIFPKESNQLNAEIYGDDP
jgi:light-regulated signal transduction histidine kinase (bacteriophytochrome)